MYLIYQILHQFPIKQNAHTMSYNYKCIQKQLVMINYEQP
jgi:hypothetical protein